MFRVLMSVSDKTGLVDFARGLVDLFGQELMIFSTGGTYDKLAEAKVPVVSLKALGIEEVMDGRVKTLQPKIFGGILARRNNPKHMRALEDIIKSFPIDMVVVNLYPFEAVASRGGSHEELIENIDIGGPSMIRAAAKNFEDVLVVVDPNDYLAVLEVLRSEYVSTTFRYELFLKVFSMTSRYDTEILTKMSEYRLVNGNFQRV